MKGKKIKKSLVGIIQADLGKVIDSYYEIDAKAQELIGRDLSKQVRTKKYERKPGNLKVARNLFSKLVDQPSTEFDSSNVRPLRDLYFQLEYILPDNDDVESFIDECVKKFDRDPLVQAQEKSRFWLKPFSAISTAMGFGAFLTGNYLATALYAASAISSLATLREDDPKLRFVTYGAVLFGAASIAFGGNELLDLEGVILIAHNIYMPGLIRTSALLAEEQKLDKLTSELRAKSEINFDRFLRYETVLKEAYQNLSYVDRVCGSEKRSKGDFLPQLERLEETLIEYLDVEATFDDVRECRVRYVPKLEEKKKPVVNVVVSQNRTATYTKDEYVQLKEKEQRHVRKKRKKKRGQSITLDEEVEDFVQEDEVEIIFSDKLVEAYETRNSLIAGYGSRALLDLVKTKLSSAKRHKNIKKGHTRSVVMIKNLQRKHGLDSDVTIYKFQPRGSLRCFYVKDDDTITVLDVMNHQEYDTLFRSK